MDAPSRILNTILAFLVIFIVVMPMGSALATPGDACPSTPVRWDLADCDIVGGGTADVCAYDASGDWVCDVSSAGTRAKVFVVEDFSSAHEYEAWGEIDGTLFCCYNNGATTIRIGGSQMEDSLNFSYYASSTSTWYNLKPHTGTAIVGEIYGFGDDDTINGSDYSGSGYSEYLYGGDHNDTINGKSGDDEIYGGTGDDTLMGGNGDDVMDGECGNDVMYGDAGSDTMRGGDDDDTMSGGSGDDYMEGDDSRDLDLTGNDKMSGGGGDDIMDGGPGNDHLCGDSETYGIGDELSDGDTDAGVDHLWANSNQDTDLCGNATTIWDGNASTGGCTGTVDNTPPPECP